MHLDLANLTSAAARLYPDWNRERQPVAVVVAKRGYSIDPDGALAELREPPAIETADRHAGDPVATPLLAARESVPHKMGGEFYVVNARAAPPKPDARVMELTLSVNGRAGPGTSKTLRVLGRRVWAGGRLLPRPTEPEPLDAIPLDYRYAFGGMDERAAPREEKFYPPNWAGRGYVADAKRCVGIELPRIEIDPYIKKPEDRPIPAGFGPLAAFWAPRAAERGTPSEDMALGIGCPYPEDAGPTFHNAAPLDQRLPKPFAGGEVVTLTNLLAGVPYGQSVSVSLPRFTPRVQMQIGEESCDFETVCDTLVVDAGKKSLFLIARVAIPWRHTDPRQAWLLVHEPAVFEPARVPLAETTA